MRAQAPLGSSGLPREVPRPPLPRRRHHLGPGLGHGGKQVQDKPTLVAEPTPHSALILKSHVEVTNLSPSTSNFHHVVVLGATDLEVESLGLRLDSTLAWGNSQVCSHLQAVVT